MTFDRVQSSDWDELHMLDTNPDPDLVIMRLAQKHDDGKLARHSMRVLFRSGTAAEDLRSLATKRHDIAAGGIEVPRKLAERLCARIVGEDPREVVALQLLMSAVMDRMEELSTDPAWSTLDIANSDLWLTIGSSCTDGLGASFMKLNGTLGREYDNRQTLGLFMRIQLTRHVGNLLKGLGPDIMGYQEWLHWFAPFAAEFLTHHGTDTLPPLDKRPEPPNIAK